ncbi:hypothetical protein BBO99_00009523 [Phytophthora kernoviae]|uniref:Uncharacterized protein n=1 Tax=Phytophthora kernoviae TaxID=325452 RepID=A0A3R7GSH0_9STRA|nr:hypothetical protein JM16_009620 [Phytophthora kernoviae]RLN15376.1 hypothetical protein BBI17_009571 [Phytophthora kernoviae]RLN73191.1 hypothetical protein BBO99_00009523 [Phytophthora kernoviae]
MSLNVSKEQGIDHREETQMVIIAAVYSCKSSNFQSSYQLPSAQDTTINQGQDETVNAASLPAKIIALTHVCERIDELLKTPEEAVKEAATTGQVQWLQRLLERFDCDVADATMIAAAKGHVEIVRLLLPQIEPEREQQKATWQVIEVATMNENVGVVNFAMRHLSEVGYGDWFTA